MTLRGFSQVSFWLRLRLFQATVDLVKLKYPESVKKLQEQAAREKRLRERLIWKSQNLVNPKRKDVGV